MFAGDGGIRQKTSWNVVDHGWRSSQGARYAYEGDVNSKTFPVSMLAPNSLGDGQRPPSVPGSEHNGTFAGLRGQ